MKEINSIDYIKQCRTDIDRLIEQSPGFTRDIKRTLMYQY